mmetsp:Transcript_3203/g.7119  ORF Transcript_3203/g.7119 Transcript_3203/m.7119 type:complete len:195 (-) Transcript_3203:2515-3099(-)
MLKALSGVFYLSPRAGLPKKPRFCSFWIYFLGSISLGFTPEQDQSRGIPALSSSQVELLYSEQGVVKYRLLTSQALHYENGDREYPKGVFVEFYEESTKGISLTGRANTVYFLAEGNLYTFRGDVELRSLRDKTQLNTEELYWSPKTKTIYTDKFIRIETDAELLTGEGVTAKQDLSYYVMSEPKGRLRVKAIQ